MTSPRPVPCVTCVSQFILYRITSCLIGFCCFCRQPFTKFVEVGRVVLINYGPDAGKLATIIDVVDSKRVLVDGPQSITGVHRQIIGTQRVALTNFVAAKLPRNATQKSLKKAWEEQGLLQKWSESSWAKKIAAKTTRANLSDFGRFKVMIAKKQKAKAIAEKLNTV
jgi:large subunit ribosomal protein L14e